MKRKRKLVRDTFYPFLEEATKSIIDAENFCQSLVVAIRQKWNNDMREKKLKDIGLIELLDDKNEDFKKYKFALELFENESVFDSLDLIEGMSNAIQSFKREEDSKRPLKELKTDFLV